VIPSVDLAALVLFESATKLGADKNNLVSCDAKVPRIGTGSLLSFFLFFSLSLANKEILVCRNILQYF
jgi:hypothetical protein